MSGMWRTLQRAAASFSSPSRFWARPWAEAHGGTLKRAPRRGFTLLEVIVATTIMAIAVVGLMASLSAAVRNAARLRDYDRAAQLARLRMNELLLDESFPRNTEVSGQFDRSLSSGLECGWRARVSLWKTPPYPVAGEFALERLDLEVWWDAGANRRTLTVNSYRRHVLTPEEAAQLAAAQ